MDTYELTKKNIDRITEIKESLFDKWEWNLGNNPKFNITKENRFSGGKLMVQSFVEKGRITEIHFYGDFFAKEGLSDLENKLAGCLYKEDEIKEMLAAEQAEDYFYNIKLEEILSCII